MAIYGIPSATQPEKEFTKQQFCIYCPKLRDWVNDEVNETAYNEFVSIGKNTLNYGYWGNEYNMAMSMLIAHYICITDPDYVQSVGADSATGGVMSSRSIDSISYSYETERTFESNPAYKFWYQTGYGRQLVAMSLKRGWVGILVSN